MIEEVGDWSRGDLRKVWLVLGAITCIEDATAVNIANATNMPRMTVSDILEKITSGQIPGMEMVKDGSIYKIEQWGKLVSKAEVKRFYKKGGKNEQG